MPRLSDTMASGVVGRWLRNHGDYVEGGDPLVEIETDKTTMELVADGAGFLSILTADGDSVETGGVLGRITASPAEPGDSEVPSPQPGPSQAAKVPNSSVLEDNTAAALSRQPRTPRATPVARKLAAQAGVDLSVIGPGIGPDGRIQRVDVERVLATRTASPIERSTASEPSRDQVLEPTRIQAIVAQRMTESKQQVPHYYVTTVADMTEAIELKRLAAELETELRLSVIDIVLYACARALAAHPAVNASWVDDRVLRRGAVNLGMAIALDEAELVVPVVHDAANLTLLELAKTRRDLTKRAQERKLVPSEVTGGTFTISNLGTFGVVEFYAIINPPESGILALGEIQEEVVVHQGQPAVRPRMTLSLSSDHRVYSGATAAKFLQTLRLHVEHPAVALLDHPE
jgi:pyruvate dehydrogenase E2 component (dihydrolipoamide acetyltransferase)